MARPRYSIIDLSSTSYYHCISRCVRRAFLCGEDQVSHKSFEHRRQWLVDRFKFLSEIFSIDICSYAVMENHYHLVLKVNKDRALEWSESEVAERWGMLYNSCNPIVERYLLNSGSAAETEIAKSDIKKWRDRLYDISWFMKNLNEYIAKEANKEDNCKGHFWEARFKSQALLDETAVLSCMVYVDLNPIRAKMAKDLKSSDFTSIQERINVFEEAQQAAEADVGKPSTQQDKPLRFQPRSLLPFDPAQPQEAINLSFCDYLELADWTGRLIQPKKKGFISASTPKILETLKIGNEKWTSLTQNFQRMFASFAGQSSVLYSHAEKRGQHWYRGVD